MPGGGASAYHGGVFVPDALCDRLEGRAEILEKTQVRYRALRAMLHRLFWRERLRANADLLHQMAFAQPLVDSVLDGALHRAEAEGWPRGSEAVKWLLALERARSELARAASRRLRRAEGEGLSELLVELEAALAAPRKIQPGHLWAAAMEILPRSLPELIRAGALCDLLERAFKRPMDFQGPLPFSAAEAGELASALLRAGEALEAVWRLVEQCDPTLGLVRFLQKRARRAPLREPRNGPEALLRAAFWHDYARARLRQLVEPKVAPVAVAEGELVALLRWLAAAERDPSARLETSDALGDARAGLFELAYELNREARLSSSSSPAAWERIADRARRAGPSPEEESAGVREELARFIRTREDARVRTTPAGSFSLESLVRRAQVLAAASPVAKLARR